MKPEDAAALQKLQGELEKFPTTPPGPFGPSLAWLIRLVHELDGRVKELEAGGVPQVIAERDIALAERDAVVSKLAAQVAELEKTYLPEPSKHFRATEPLNKVNEHALSDSENVATRSDR